MVNAMTKLQYINQLQLENLRELVQPQKAVIIYGARRCGKTTLITHYQQEYTSTSLMVNGEDIEVQHYLGSQSIEKLKSFVGNVSLLIIDEAQKVPNIGLNLKLIIDNIPNIKIIATGLSSFDLAGSINEPLTGRKYSLRLYPLAQSEIAITENIAQTKANLESRLIFGSYPEVIIIKDNKARIEYLKEIVSSYLYKDILEFDGIKHANKISRLLQLIAFQIGKEVSCNELATQLEMSKNTVDKYLELLEKCFVIIKLKGFSRNLRKEISKTSRYYFVDIGIRNALINNFNPLMLRDDVGMLWENYVFIERLKKQEYQRLHSNNYFWRTYSQKEIDLIEERDGKLYGYEFKWGDKKIKAPKEWITAYPNGSFEVINPSNYLSFIS